MVLWGEEGGIREKHCTVTHCRDHCKHAIQMTAKSWIITPMWGERVEKLQHASINGNENRCQSNLLLNGVRLEIENILLLSHAGYNYESEQSAANHTSLLLRGRVNVSAGTSDGAVSYFNLSIQI